MSIVRCIHLYVFCDKSISYCRKFEDGCIGNELSRVASAVIAKYIGEGGMRLKIQSYPLRPGDGMIIQKSLKRGHVFIADVRRLIQPVYYIEHAGDGFKAAQFICTGLYKNVTGQNRFTGMYSYVI